MPSQLPAGTDLSSPQIKLLSSWNDAFTELNAESVGTHFHKDLRRSIYPRSIGQPEQSKEDLLKEISAWISHTTEFNVGYTPCYLNLLFPG